MITGRKLNKFSLTELGWDKLAWINHAPVAQLVEHWAVTWEVVSSTPAGSTLRILKNSVESGAFVITSANR